MTKCRGAAQGYRAEVRVPKAEDRSVILFRNGVRALGVETTPGEIFFSFVSPS